MSVKIIDDTPLISVIIPIYNVQNYLKLCLESICRQTYRNLEIILINDGSKDDSLQICDEFAGKDHRVKVISQNNQGVSIARNRGILECRGEYICFIDGDDYVDDYYIELLFSEIKKHDVDMSICAAVFFGENKLLQQERKRQKESQVLKPEIALNIILNDHKFNTSVWGKLFRTDVIKKKEPIKFEAGLTIGEDLVWLVEYFRHCQKVSVNNSPLYCYRLTQNSAMNKKLTRKKAMDSYYSQTKALAKVKGWANEAEGTLKARSFMYAIQAGCFLKKDAEIMTILDDQNKNVCGFLQSKFSWKRKIGYIFVYICLQVGVPQAFVRKLFKA